MNHHSHTGLWHNYLPAHCTNMRGFYNQVLHQAHNGCSANRSNSDITHHLVAELSGYQIFWLLGNIASQPKTSQYASARMQYQSSQLHAVLVALPTSRALLRHCLFQYHGLECFHSTCNKFIKPLILSCAKAPKYLQYVLAYLKILRDGASTMKQPLQWSTQTCPLQCPLYCDPAFQKWHTKGEIVMKHIPGI